MSWPLLVPLLITILVVAILYSSVGHGGASGYIATLALFSVAPEAFKPTALVLNIVVAAIATYSFARAGHFSWRLFWPFAATSIPCSFIGGYLSLPPHRLSRPLRHCSPLPPCAEASSALFLAVAVCRQPVS